MNNEKFPNPPEITITAEQTGLCPECGNEFEFSLENMHTPFVVTEGMVVAVLRCMTPGCRYILPLHIILKTKTPDENGDIVEDDIPTCPVCKQGVMLTDTDDVCEITSCTNCGYESRRKNHKTGQVWNPST